MSRAITGATLTAFNDQNVVDICLDLGVQKRITLQLQDGSTPPVPVDLSNYTVRAEIVEGFNPGNGAKPSRVQRDAEARMLPTRMTPGAATPNSVDIQFPGNITSAIDQTGQMWPDGNGGMAPGNMVAEWQRQPIVNRPVWGFYTVTALENGNTGFEQEFTIAKGAVQIRYIV